MTAALALKGENYFIRKKPNGKMQVLYVMLPLKLCFLVHGNRATFKSALTKKKFRGSWSIAMRYAIQCKHLLLKTRNILMGKAKSFSVF